MHRSLAFAATLFAGLALFATACSPGDTTINSSTTTLAGINADGEGRAYGPPDVVFLRLGVTTEKTTVAEARESAASAMSGVIDSLKRNGLQDKDIQTTQFSVQPQYDFTNRVQTLRGYRVTNTVTAKIKKLDTAGKVIDDAAAAGGNAVVIQSISFSIEDQDALQKQAREAAVAQAKERATQLARNAGVSLGKVQSISESAQSVMPQAEAALLAAPRAIGGDTATPVQTGELVVVVHVTMLYAID